jgi:hypothetical protein
MPMHQQVDFGDRLLGVGLRPKLTFMAATKQRRVAQHNFHRWPLGSQPHIATVSGAGLLGVGQLAIFGVE